ncbi:MAG: helix-turn-helix transcriptional regulator [Candidatus Omnitrophota bacterium]|nr:helix-turn-helix transcriptional regulator [Candidatus Omnitrophota bacterium]
MKNNWLWDIKTTEAEIKAIFKDSNHKDFFKFAALLLARNNEPKQVFSEYLSPLLFCQHWQNIKRQMRKDKWVEPRIIFWQAIFEQLKEKYKKRGVVFNKELLPAKSAICKEVGEKISFVRREQNLSQKELAVKIGISQQLISRIEKGRENASLSTLANIARALGKKIEINLSSQ